MATKSPKVARTASFIGAGMYFTVGLIPVIIGLLAPQLVSSVPANDRFLPALAEIVMPKGLYVLLIGSLVAAVLATVDSTLLTISAFVTHNLMGHRFYGLKEKNKVRTSRVIVMIAGVIAYIMALNATRIYDLTVMASSFGMTGVLVCMFVGMFMPKLANTSAAVWTLVVGILTFLLAKYFFHTEAPFMTSILFSCVTYITRYLSIKALAYYRNQDMKTLNPVELTSVEVTHPSELYES